MKKYLLITVLIIGMLSSGLVQALEQEDKEVLEEEVLEEQEDEKLEGISEQEDEKLEEEVSEDEKLEEEVSEEEVSEEEVLEEQEDEELIEEEISEDEQDLTGLSEWAKEDYYLAEELGLLPDNYKYTVNNPSVTYTNREDFTEILVRMLSDLEAIDLREEESSPFEDVDSLFVDIAYSNNLINGYTETQFAPDDNLTREQMITLMDRALIELGIDIPVNDEYIEFSDADDISDYANNHVQNAYKLGLVEGTGDGNIDPLSNVTNEQAIVFTMRLRSLILEHQ